jgi:hypothetical protein
MMVTTKNIKFPKGATASARVKKIMVGIVGEASTSF